MNTMKCQYRNCNNRISSVSSTGPLYCSDLHWKQESHMRLRENMAKKLGEK